MTAGDFVGEGFELANGATATIRPGSSDEWVVHNIYIENGKQCVFRRIADTYSINVDTITGSLLVFSFHLDYDNYLTLTNNSGSTINVAYDGVSVT